MPNEPVYIQRLETNQGEWREGTLPAAELRPYLCNFFRLVPIAPEECEAVADQALAELAETGKYSINTVDAFRPWRSFTLTISRPDS